MKLNRKSSLLLLGHRCVDRLLTTALCGVLLTSADGVLAQIASTPPAGLEAIKINAVENNQIGVSGDYLIGYGKISVPFGLGFANSSIPANRYETGNKGGVDPNANLQTRNSTYYGGTLSYSYGQAWFFDFSYSVGNSHVPNAEETLFSRTFLANYKIDDDWYQFYVRYAFPQLRGKRFSAYIRAGATFVDSTLSASGTFNAESYAQHNPETDIDGNLGLGLGYSIYSGSKIRLSAIAEGEGFAGDRSQDITEYLNNDPSPYKLDNLTYGGLGRSSLRFEFFPGRSRRLRLFADAGVQFRYTEIEYGKSAGFAARGFGEVLWGPFVKAGLKFSF